MFQRILVPLDYSDKDTAALQAAVRIARESDARVTLLHVIEVIEEAEFGEFQDFYTQLEDKAVARMQEVAERLLVHHVLVDHTVVYGKPAREILRYTMQNDIDLVIVGSHKIDVQRPNQGWGTVSHQVSLMSQCPVLLVR